MELLTFCAKVTICLNEVATNPMASHKRPVVNDLVKDFDLDAFSSCIWHIPAFAK